MTALGFMLLILAGIFYFIPTAISKQRDTEHDGMIFFINLVFGWTVLGWIAALIWAIVEKPKVHECPSCKSPVAVAAEICPQCQTVIPTKYDPRAWKGVYQDRIAKSEKD